MRRSSSIGVALIVLLSVAGRADAHAIFHDKATDLPPPPRFERPTHVDGHSAGEVGRSDLPVPVISEARDGTWVPAEDKPILFLHERAQEDGTVEITGTLGTRGSFLTPDGRAEEAVGVAICPLDKDGKKDPTGACFWAVWLLQGVGGGVGVVVGGLGGAAGGAAAGAFVCSAAGAPEAVPGCTAAGGTVGGLLGVYYGARLGELPATIWGLQGCPLPPGYRFNDFQWNFQYGTFDWSFPGFRDMPIHDSWLEGVGNGICSGGDVARIPVVVIDGLGGSIGPGEVGGGGAVGVPGAGAAAPGLGQGPIQPGEAPIPRFDDVADPFGGAPEPGGE